MTENEKYRIVDLILNCPIENHKSLTEGIKLLISKFPEILTSEYYGGENLLHIACIGNNFDLIHYCIESGIDINSVDYEFKTPLHKIAELLNCKSDLHLSLLNLIINKGGNINSLDINNCSSVSKLKISVESTSKKTDKSFIDKVELFLKHGANIRDQNKRGLTLIYNAKTEYGIKYFMEKGLSINHQNIDGITPLMSSVKRDINIFNNIIRVNPDVLLKDKNGWTALHHNCYQDPGDISTKIITTLINQGCSPNDPDSIGRTPVYLCAQSCDPKALKHIVSLGGNPTIRNNENISPLEAVLYIQENDPSSIYVEKEIKACIKFLTSFSV